MSGQSRHAPGAQNAARRRYFPILDHCAPPDISFENYRKHECLTCRDWSIKLVMYEDHERIRL